ncbi:hypothetical protein W97_01650 [Coniosporium apollinis CBS 100218]|uniref:Uncharacterized protein n=1 Tax=Coniosporium apollinis (strain CBS 100218) TaxID=1168221 RepID=R7YKL2_CONA1|nr:uncharacterized protein W97_01650 [Coniosporium apollinis CBS 100218]EON62428.1 hypothetical protein W97_01650 [Coniosporium apollinis CBS 100218]
MSSDSAAAATCEPVQVTPNRSVGLFALGASVQSVLSYLKSEPATYSTIDVSYSHDAPIASPILISLPRNGLRLRFDGQDQRLRLIEVLDFTKTRLGYKNDEIFRHAGGAEGRPGTASSTGPLFRHVYNLMGPTFAGEYMPPTSDGEGARGTYILSYPGMAFSFPLLASAWSPTVDFVSLLYSSATSPATNMVVFNGESWQEARQSLFTRSPPNPRSLWLAGKGSDSGAPDEIEAAKIYGEGRIELVRRSSPSFWIILSETTPQDLVAELGPPDAIYRKSDRRLSIHRTPTPNGVSGLADGIGNAARDNMQADDSESNHSSALHTDSEHEALSDGDEDQFDDSDGDTDLSTPEDSEVTGRQHENRECFYNYFHHGFDLLISKPTHPSPPSPTADRRASPEERSSSPSNGDPCLPSNHLTATKISFHGNVPGSYSFNRHRRSRWTLEHVPTEHYREPLNSEMSFTDISGRLKEVYRGAYASKEEERLHQRGMVIKPGLGDSPGSSCELLGGWEDSTVVAGARNPSTDATAVSGESGLTTELFGFPGMVFEVMKNGAVSCLTVY